jgi:hypothetical protein
VAHPRIRTRSLATAGVTAALVALPMAGPAFALGDVALEPVTAPVENVLPAPVADAVDEAATPVKSIVEPIVEQVLKAAPAPVKEAAETVTGQQPSAGPVETAPVPPASAPRTSTAPAGSSESSGPAPAPAAAPAPSSESKTGTSGFLQARDALRSQPMTTTPFPMVSDLMAAQAPEAAGRERNATPITTGSGAPGWLVATATGMLVLLGAAHLAYADGRLMEAKAG